MNSHLLVEAGITNVTMTPIINKPATTRLVRPTRSAIPPNSEPNAPIKLPTARVYTKNVKLICSLIRSKVETEPVTYSS